MVTLKCPMCQGDLTWDRSEKELVGATTDCPTCGADLILVVQAIDFHQWMHEQNPQWPADGKGTGKITL
jgi:endogenous inhibitor of DNA gyrase (YacG/DUF329 family)